jgi:PAS domain S-box-containing protein
MDEQLRSTGIEPAGLVPWGTHMCLFYRTPGELVDALAAYFKAGLQNNEFCVWITSDPLIKTDARLALERLFPEQEQSELKRYRRLGQIEFYDYKEWYVRSMQTPDRLAAPLPDASLPPINQGSVFSPDRVLQSWVEKEEQARRLGFDGLRVSGDTSWLGVLFQDEKPIIWNHEIWSHLAHYENRVGKLMQAGGSLLDPHPHILALCTYDLEQCSPAEIIEATTHHELTLIHTGGDRPEMKTADGHEKFDYPENDLQGEPEQPPAWRAIYSASFDRVEEALEAGQKSYQALVESSANHVFMLSSQGVYLTSNDRVRQFGLRRAEQLVGKRLEEVYPPELAESYRQQLERVLETGLTVEFEHPMSQLDGEHTHLDTLYPIYRYGLVWAVGGACHDISQRKRSELARKEREERLRNLFESAPDSIYLKDCSLRYTLVNPAMVRLLDLPVEQITGKGAADLFGAEAAAHIEQVDRRVLAGEIVEEIETRIVRGERRHFHIIEAPVRDENGQITGLTGIVRDITRRQRTGKTE